MTNGLNASITAPNLAVLTSSRRSRSAAKAVKKTVTPARRGPTAWTTPNRKPAASKTTKPGGYWETQPCGVTSEFWISQNSENPSTRPARCPAAKNLACKSYTIASIKLGFPGRTTRRNTSVRKADSSASPPANQSVGIAASRFPSRAKPLATVAGSTNLVARTPTTDRISVPRKRMVRDRSAPAIASRTKGPASGESRRRYAGKTTSRTSAAPANRSACSRTLPRRPWLSVPECEKGIVVTAGIYSSSASLWKQVVAQDVEEGSHSVTPRNLLAFEVSPARVSNRNFEDP